MKDAIEKRFEELMSAGKQLLRFVTTDQDGDPSFYLSAASEPDGQAWMISTTNLIHLITPRDSSYLAELERLNTHELLGSGLPLLVLRRMFGVLTAAHADWESGLLRRLEYLIAGETFDDFLDKAAAYHQGNKKVEAAVLASAVLEDTVKRIARKHQLTPAGKSLEELIDDLIKADVITGVKGKRVKAAAGVRNHALHAEWESFDIKDAGTLISTVRDLIEDPL